MHIDDVLTGAETLLESKELTNQLINIICKDSMHFHEWCVNNYQLTEISKSNF